MNVRLVMLLVWVSSNLGAQAVIEATAGAARATTTAAPAQKVGNSINGAFDKLNRALQDAEKGKPGSSSAATSPANGPIPAAASPHSLRLPLYRSSTWRWKIRRALMKGWTMWMSQSDSDHLIG